MTMSQTNRYVLILCVLLAQCVEAFADQAAADAAYSSMVDEQQVAVNYQGFAKDDVDKAGGRSSEVSKRYIAVYEIMDPQHIDDVDGYMETAGTQWFQAAEHAAYGFDYQNQALAAAAKAANFYNNMQWDDAVASYKAAEALWQQSATAYQQGSAYAGYCNIQLDFAEGIIMYYE
jgi:hypothetical protein